MRRKGSEAITGFGKMANYHRWLPDLDVRRYPNAVTIGDLIAEHMGLGVHCNKIHPFPSSCGWSDTLPEVGQRKSGLLAMKRT